MEKSQSRADQRPAVGGAEYIAAYVARSTAEQTYLQPGDTVTIRVDRLGALTNRVAG